MKRISEAACLAARADSLSVKLTKAIEASECNLTLLTLPNCEKKSRSSYSLVEGSTFLTIKFMYIMDFFHW